MYFIFSLQVYYISEVIVIKYAVMVELVDTIALGAIAEMCGGSTPSNGTGRSPSSTN